MQLTQLLPVGYKLVHLGTKFDVLVQTQRQAELSKIMPKPSVQDFSATIRSPMPGLVISTRVKKGDKVVVGQVCLPFIAIRYMEIPDLRHCE